MKKLDGIRQGEIRIGIIEVIKMEKAISKDDLPDVLEVQDIQRFLSIGRVQAYELVNSGAFHVVKIGRRIKVSKDVFIRWLEGAAG
ncbi:helix-turn-helix domain-containing protein [Brevibacillus reuszeri]|uniref:helix-turn-helix domain-containing protein n=1 Tax=Brevibacillus reuszeri TaxID=54915 RepID=UPI003D1DC1D7